MNCRIGRRLVALLTVCAIVWQAHAFELTDMDGKKHKLTDYRGKWVVVNHWATWCTPCLVELPDLDEFQLANKDKVVVLGVVDDVETDQKVRPLLKRVRVGFPNALGIKANTKHFPDIKSVPTSFIYNPSGKLVETHSGALGIEDLEARISKGR
ncbi:MAG: TlpA family protein disulfide reductase [Casimicrobium sp.]